MKGVLEFFYIVTLYWVIPLLIALWIQKTMKK